MMGTRNHAWIIFKDRLQGFITGWICYNLFYYFLKCKMIFLISAITCVHKNFYIKFDCICWIFYLVIIFWINFPRIFCVSIYILIFLIVIFFFFLSFEKFPTSDLFFKKFQCLLKTHITLKILLVIDV